METRLRRGHAATAATVTAVVGVSVGLTWCLRGRRSVSEDGRPTVATTRTDTALLASATAPIVENCATAHRSSFDSGQLLAALCAGGGGFFLFYVPKENQKNFLIKMKKKKKL